MPPSKLKATAASTTPVKMQTSSSTRNKKCPDKYKQLPITTFCVTVQKNSNDGVCRKEPNAKRTSRVGTLNKKGNKDPLKTTNGKSISKRTKKSFKRNTSGSFDKYGVCLPNFEEVLEYQKTIEQDKLAIEHLTHEMSLPLETVIVTLAQPKRHETVLDCKHLTNDELHKLFSVNLEHMEGILNGTIYSKRHDRFMKQSHEDNFTANDLRYNTSTITFTFEQKKLLLSSLRKRFGKEELCKNDQYFFKVLLPELCLNIFMAVHDMSREVAINYLDERPVDVIP